ARLDTARPDHAVDIDQAQLRALATALASVQAAVPDSHAPDSLQLLQYPGVRQEAEPDIAAIQKAARQSLTATLDGLQAMRDSEGERLAQILRERAQQVAEH